MRYIDYSLNEADLGETPQPDSKAQLGTVAELQFLRFRRPHDPHVPVVHCGHSFSSVLNLHVWQQSLDILKIIKKRDGILVPSLFLVLFQNFKHTQIC